MGEMQPWKLLLLSVMPWMIQTSAEAVKGNGKKDKRNLRGQYCKQSSDVGGRGQKNQTPPLLSDRRAQRYRMNLWKWGGNREYTERKTGRGETKREKPLPIVWMKCYLCLGTELIVCSRLLSCFFPEPPCVQTSACSKSEGDWCESCAMGRSTLYSTSPFLPLQSTSFSLTFSL